MLLAVVLLIAVWAVLKRRIKRALKVAAVLYVILLAVRLSQIQTDQERLINAAAILGLFAIAWVLVWGITSIVAHRRDSGSRPRAR
ncbi:MAG: hypothetical protein HY675_06595 [Chloroflexi bacterium]|nr:hypothetical protein [Chloroflexota bacterium]